MAEITKEKEIGASTSPALSDVEIGEIKDVKNADAALDFLRHEEGGVREMTLEDERKLRRKIDWMIVPLMWCCYCLQYLDKTLINYANVMGLEEDTNMTKDQFSNLALIFYVSYLAFEFPHGYAMQRLPTAKYLGAMVFLWGVIVTVTSACKSYPALVATRVLLGVFESAVAPSLILITSMWYKRNEQPPRVGLWYLGTGTGTVIGSLISFGFQHVTNRTFYSWQIMFLTVGLVTCAVGILVFFLLPDNPMKSRLTHEEKVWAIERLRENQTGIENIHFKPGQVAECFLDPQTWLLALICCSSSVPNGAVSSFQATIIKSFGYDSKQTALLSIPSGAVNSIAILSSTYLAGRYNQRGIQIIALLVPGILGGALMAFLPDTNKPGKLIGNYLTNVIGASLPLLYSWVSANYAGHTKKVTMNALLLISFCVGNIIGPLTFRGQDAPGYVPAKITIIVTCAAAIGFTVVLWFYYVGVNRRRDAKMEEGEGVQRGDVAFADMTDLKNKAFRYRLPNHSPYTTLDSSKKEIRLVTIAPNSDLAAPIQCDLSTVRLSSRPSYTALSYVWGQRFFPIYILLDGQNVKITLNLFAALRRLRNPSWPCIFWIDALCINQEDKAERASQVAMMREIYGSAAETVVWLGENSGSGLAMELIRNFPGDGEYHDMLKLGCDTWYARHWDALHSMLEASYWERCWTLQEIIVSENITIMYGDESTSWDRLNFLRSLSHNDRLPAACQSVVCSYFQRVAATNAWYSNFRAGQSMSMHEALLLTDYRRSGEESDKVFSLLGLVDSCGIEPTYTTDAIDVYRRTVQRIVEMEESLEVLSSVCALRNEYLFERIEKVSRRYCGSQESNELSTATSCVSGISREESGLLEHLLDTALSSWNTQADSTSDSVAISSWAFPPGYQWKIRRHMYTEIGTRPQDRIIPFGATGNSKPGVNISGAVAELRGALLSSILPSPHSEASGSKIKYLSSKREEVQLPEQGKRLEEVCRPLWQRFINQATTPTPGTNSWTSVYGNPLQSFRAFQQTLLLGADDNGAKCHKPFFDNPFWAHLFAWTGIESSNADFDHGPLHAITHLIFQRTLNSRSFFVTESGYMGFASMEVAAGDVVCLLRGGPTPYVLRRYDVHGIMEGEAWSGLEDSLETIRII
ncbi:hypothetical protein PRZ48_005209 [Zasmidium cellare]|uniref:Major facilitator superfamily (MFS) profile domain-containing protein n=1 Tax=Zasmidium cellare TaxID=395010 RepID=A0ABR0ETY8_ZASCE|nr:hypothetical protein PRZ48_005209 [Zasmidium cellare]